MRKFILYADKCMLLWLQHRFYGKSIPYGGDKEVAYKNASTQGYLSSTQALADYATLILDLKNNLTASESPVVVLGGSYGGSMVILSLFVLFHYEYSLRFILLVDRYLTTI